MSWKDLLTPEQIAECEAIQFLMRENWLAMSEGERVAHTREMFGLAKHSGICDICGGRIVQEVRGYLHGTFHFDIPTCENCKKVYSGETDTPKVGIAEFQDICSRPFTL